jgi:hypothetical protein
VTETLYRLIFNRLHGMTHRELSERPQASARDELRRAAAKVFDDARAEVFLKSAHPALGGQSPLAYCADPVSLRACLGLLPARRRA